MLHVLLCSIGRRVELTRHFIDSVRRLAPAGSRVVGLDIDPLAPALSFVDEAVLVPRVESPAFAEVIESMIDECRGHRVLIVPLSDREVAPLAGLANKLSSSEVFFSVVPPVAVPVVEDKWTTMQFFRGLGLLAPDSWLPGVDLGSLPYPVYAKPRKGSAGEGGLVLRNERWAELALDEIEEPVIQELMTGDEITTDVLSTLDGRYLCSVSRRRLQVRGGEVMKAVTVRMPGLEDACRTIVEHLRPRGPITVQAFTSSDGVLRFSEINARLGGGAPLAIAAGVPITDLMVAESIGLPLPSDLSYEEGVSLTRFDESLFLTREAARAVPHRDLRSR